MIDKLVGGIIPIGETNYDNKAKNNLEVMIKIVGHYIDEICEVAQTNSYMFSVQNCQKIAEDFVRGLKDAYESLSIVNELAEEYKGGWIPCSERLPECNLTYDIFKRPSKWMSEPVLVTVKSTECDRVHYYVATDMMTGNSEKDISWLMSCGYGGSAVYEQEIIAWQPLPPAYKPKE